MKMRETSGKFKILAMVVVLVVIGIAAYLLYVWQSPRSGIGCLLECATADITVLSSGGGESWDVRIDKLFDHGRATYATHQELKEGDEITLIFLETGALNNPVRTTSTPPIAVPVDEYQSPPPGPTPEIGKQYRANLAICLEIFAKQNTCPKGEGWRGALLAPGS